MKKYTIISIILFIFDISAFVCALHPKVPDEYRDYYLKHTIRKQEYIDRALKTEKLYPPRPICPVGTC